MGFLLSLPIVQTEIAKYFTKELKETHGVDINIEAATITVFGKVKLKKVLIRDHHKDTLISINMLRTDILDFEELVDGRLIFGKLLADGLFLNIKNYKGENYTNLDNFIDAFDDGKPSSGNFLMKVESLVIRNSRFTMHDFNRDKPKDVDFKNLNGNIKKFKIKGPDVTMAINNLSFKDYTGLEVTKLKSNFTYTKKNIILEDLALQTPFSNYEGLIRLDYKREDFKDFNNKVVFTFLAKEAKISSSDIYHYYKDIGKDIIYDLEGNFKGTLNKLEAKNFSVKDNLNTTISGDLVFHNMFDKQNDFLMKGSVKELNTSAKNLEKLLPTVLGNGFFPNEIYKLGAFKYNGDIELTPKYLISDFELTTAIGSVNADIKMQNINDVKRTAYQGYIETNQLNIGYLLNEKEIGKISIKATVDGIGFTQNTINTSLKGDILALDYNNYRYKNILLDGQFKKPIFKGLLNINDPNLMMDFDGLIDVSKKENVYQFNAKVDYANLKALNFMSKDSIAIFKGRIHSDLIGNSIDNLYGQVFVASASFQNNKKVYAFDELTANSFFDKNRERQINLNSGDLLNGNITGKYSFKDVIPLIENALGSTYSNFSPNKIRKGQYINFNFGVFSQLLEVFYPEITLDNNSQLKGKISGDENLFELDLKTKFVNLQDVQLKNVNIKVDNKNPLFNTYIAIDSLLHKSYKISDFNLINVTSNDTLFMRTEFKGGKKAKDNYTLNFYHTIDQQKKNVLGFQKSEIEVNNNLWTLNNKEEKNVAVVFDNKLTNFDFQNILLTHLDQSIAFQGQMTGSTEKDLSIVIDKVLLEEFLPELDDISFKGQVNGDINIIQKNNIYKPNSDLYIKDLIVNDYDIGDFAIQLLGKEDTNVFDFKSYIATKGKKTFGAEGEVIYEGKNSRFVIDIGTESFNIGAFNSLGGEVISNIRGFVSGNAKLEGTLNQPKLNGRLFLSQAGLKIPYINVDFDINDNAIVDLTENQFKISNTKLTDIKYNTEGYLNGTINHRNLNNWLFDLKINTDRLVAFDKEDDDETPYYGIAFIKGNAEITGPIDKLAINVKATSEKGTKIRIPISNTLSVSENSYIYFISPEEKYNIVSAQEIKAIRGLELNFDLDINKNAEFEIILDKSSGHAMKGTGEGSITMAINTLGKFNIDGDFHIWDGTYDYRYRGLINKKFEVAKGGYIVWNGDPFKAQINAKAIYKTMANPSLLLSDFDSNTASRRIPVEVGIIINGTIDDPKPQFSLDFPNVTSVFKSEIETQLNTQDIKDQQVFHLLATGTFSNPNLNALNQDLIINNAVEALSSMVGDVINTNENINVNIDYSAGRKVEGEIPINDATVGLRTSFIISDRLSFRGSLGVPVGGFTQNAFIGSGEFLFRVNQDGSLNFRTFYRENDINFIGEGIGFTSGLGLSYLVDFNNLKELREKIFNSFKSQKAIRREDEISDSYETPDYLYFPSKAEDKKKTESDKKDKPSEGD